MDAIILGVGSELTIGSTINTNAAWLSRRLLDAGIATRMHVTVPDDMALMGAEIERCAKMADLLVITGGLGPTEDDFTRDAVEQVFGLEYELRTEAFEAYKVRCLQLGRTIPTRGHTQFTIPKGGVELPNVVGIAWGFAWRHNRRQRHENTTAAIPAPAAPAPFSVLAPTEGVVAILPGVPVEMEHMTEHALLPYLERIRPPAPRVFADEVRVAGAPEADVNERAKEFLSPTNDPSGSITIYEEAGGIVLRFSTTDTDESRANAKLAAVVAKVRDRFGELVYGGKGETVAGALAAQLARHQLTIGLAESCTGGLATHLLSRVPGISAFLCESIVAYSNKAKIQRVGVPASIIDTVGAVSVEAAAALAQGMCQTASVDVGIGITGVAGPTGGTTEKPVGLVCIGVSLDGNTISIAQRFHGDRFHIQRRSAQHALNLARIHIQKLRGT